jgi:hypothetical protein
VATIVATRLETLYGPHRLAYALGRPRSTIYGVLRRERISRLSFIDRPTRTVVRYERAKPGELLHMDVKNWAGSAREAGGGSTAQSSASPVEVARRTLATTTSTWQSTITVGSASSELWPTRRDRPVPNSCAMLPSTSPQKASPSNG